MDKEVLVRVKGIQVSADNEEQEPIELLVPGNYFIRNGNHYVRYEERMEDFSETTVNYVKYNANYMEVRKQGLINANMIFEPGKRSQCFYTTPYGTFPMGLTPSLIKIEEGEDTIHLQVKYAMDIHEEHVADCSLSFDVYGKGAKFEL